MAGNRPGPAPKAKTPMDGVAQMATIPDPPDYFTEPAAVIWWSVTSELHRRGLLFEADLELIAQYCFELCQADEAARAIQGEGLFFTDKNGDRRRNPAILVRSKSLETAAKYAKLLGLSPYGRERTRGKVQEEQPKDPLDGLI